MTRTEFRARDGVAVVSVLLLALSDFAGAQPAGDLPRTTIDFHHQLYVGRIGK